MPLFEAVIYFFVFLLGACVGSFLNVVIARMNTSLTLRGRSFCFSCGYKLSWHELIPLASFAVLRGKCRVCKSKISWQYPAVETLTGIVFALAFWKVLGFTFAVASVLELLYVWLTASLLIVILAYDLKHKIIPDDYAYGFAALAFARLGVEYALFPGIIPPNWHDYLAGPILAAPLAALWLVSRGRWIGLGDAKLMLGIGWFLGLLSGIDAMILAFWIGAVLGIVLIIISKVGKKYGWTLKSEIPFAPFLILGLFLAFLGISPLGFLTV